MKRIILILSLACSLLLTNCILNNCSSKHKQEQKNEKANYVCSMHPEVTSEKPGKCPKCGMDLIKQEKKSKYNGTVYSCPMHPEEKSDKPGFCPKCGMEMKLNDEKSV